MDVAGTINSKLQPLAFRLRSQEDEKLMIFFKWPNDKGIAIVTIIT